MYQILVEKRAQRDLKDLSADLFKQVIDHIQALSKNPRPAGCRKIVGSQSDWRIRVGTYRVIYEILDREKTVRIYRVKHRKDVYR
jgi:mRNA interferase RelE/StbE